MAKQKKPPEVEAGCPAWMATYSDMVTLLMTFFIVLLSMSSTDEVKFNAFVRSFSNLPDAVIEELMGDVEPHDKESAIEDQEDDKSPIDQLYDNLHEYLQDHGLDDSITMQNIDGVVYIRFDSDMFFEPNEYVMRQDSIPVLSFIGHALKEYEEHIRMINSLGFTATIDNGSYWMLSGERAAIVAIHLNEVCNIVTDKITTMGFGNRYPVASNNTSEGRAKNRRVELIIVGVESTTDFNVEKFLEEYHAGNMQDDATTTLDGLVNDEGDFDPAELDEAFADVDVDLEPATQDDPAVDDAADVE